MIVLVRNSLLLLCFSDDGWELVYSMASLNDAHELEDKVQLITRGLKHVKKVERDRTDVLPVVERCGLFKMMETLYVPKRKGACALRNKKRNCDIRVKRFQCDGGCCGAVYTR
jgi:hypothetical protein